MVVDGAYTSRGALLAGDQACAEVDRLGKEGLMTVQSPLRSLVDPHTDAPIRTQCRQNRRHGHRFPCRIEARMQIGQSECEVECVDVGYEGVKVLAPDDMRPAPGVEVLVTAQTDAGLFGDNLVVTNTEQAAEGTLIHFRLSER